MKLLIKKLSDSAKYQRCQATATHYCDYINLYIDKFVINDDKLSNLLIEARDDLLRINENIKESLSEFSQEKYKIAFETLILIPYGATNYTLSEKKFVIGSNIFYDEQMADICDDKIRIHTGISIEKVPAGFKIKVSGHDNIVVKEFIYNGELCLFVKNKSSVRFIKGSPIARLELVPDYIIEEVI